jgi:hypothetical protein
MAVTTNRTGRLVDATYTNVKETFPVSTAGAGTVSTVNGADRKVVGSGTAFTTDFSVGDYIWFKTADELAEIENIVSDTEMSLRIAPETTATGDTYGIIKKNNYSNISWLIDPLTDADINKFTFKAGTSKTYGNSKSNTLGGGKRLPPILIDSTANSNTVFISAE